MLKLYAKTPTVGARSETELLLCCARTCIDAETAERVRTLLQTDIDWSHLTGTALQHGVMPLLYWSLNATCPEAVPPAVLRQLRDRFYTNVENNLSLTGELVNFLNLLEAHGIPAIPFKGPVLAASVYGNLALRQCGDLDILVHERDVQRAKELLMSQGYRHNAHPWEGYFLQSELVRQDGRVSVDLHWGIAPKDYTCQPNPEYVWERLVPVSLLGTTVLTLSPEDSLLLLCAHGTKEYWQRLNRICDVAELVRHRPQLNWGEVLQQARRLRSERMLYLSLHLANDLLGATLPADVLSRVQADPIVLSLAAQVHTWLLREMDGSPDASDLSMFPLSEKALFRLRVRERWRDRVPYFLRRLRCLLPLPTSLSFLYYLLRPLRLMRAYGGSPFKRLLRLLCGG
ncbi:MAG: nucleotidyltransferase family protein [Abditibacteriales bacterium]|nr:nucleotidyltransferase family protein [Abditibacteriales bacterium]MDW8364365.1 nucleotidyltransferase family protein [Abditibacteriales bacterium]